MGMHFSFAEMWNDNELIIEIEQTAVYVDPQGDVFVDRKAMLS